MSDCADVAVATLVERPDLVGSVWKMPDMWDEFMDHDLVAEGLFSVVVPHFRHLAVVATDPDDVIVGHGTAMAFCFDRDGRRELPHRGFDQALIWANQDLVEGVEPDTACALEVSIHPEWLGRGLSSLLFGAIRNAARSAGLATLYAPVRPNGKHLEPDTDIESYVRRTRPDGLPQDAWLRVHARLGGVIERVAVASQTITGSLDQWRSWTGVPFDSSGPVRVPGGLVPVHCMIDQNVAVYVEPNVWVRHDLDNDPAAQCSGA